MFFTKRKAILLFIICLIFFFLTYQDVKSSEITSVTGYAKVTDGDTIKIDTFKIRLNGIDAPEKKQKCKRPYFTIFMFTFYEDYFCGQKSTEALIKKINNQKKFLLAIEIPTLITKNIISISANILTTFDLQYIASFSSSKICDIGVIITGVFNG